MTTCAQSVPVIVLEARERDHSEEVARLQMQVALYRDTLEQHGIEPPNREGEELLALWRRCAHLMEMTHRFVIELGTSKEMLEVFS